MNILTATKFLVHSLWDRTQADLGGRNIGECVKAIRGNADLADPIRSPDPVAFIYIVAWLMHDLVPEDVIRRHEDDISEAMGGLVQIITDSNGSAILVGNGLGGYITAFSLFILNTGTSPLS